MKKKNSTDSATFFSKTEAQAKDHPVRALQLNGQGERQLGLLLVGEDLSPGEIRAALGKLSLSAAKKSGAPSKDKASSQATDRSQLLELLTTELDRVSRTRLPCALLLLGLEAKGKKDNGAMELIGATVADHLHQVDILAQVEAGTYALVLPGTNTGKAIKKAKQLKQAVLEQQHLPLGMGIAICHAYDNLDQDTFLAAAQTELCRSHEEGDGAICHGSLGSQDDSCQVTVEEREQLFSFLQKG